MLKKQQLRATSQVPLTFKNRMTDFVGSALVRRARGLGGANKTTRKGKSTENTD